MNLIPSIHHRPGRPRQQGPDPAQGQADHHHLQATLHQMVFQGFKTMTHINDSPRYLTF